MQPSDLGTYRSVSEVALSPDGATLAFVVTAIDLPANRYRGQIWVVPTNGSSVARPLTAGDSRDGSPAWSPDGRRLAFASERGEPAAKYTLHVVPVDGAGETVTLATATEAFDTLRWSPGGHHLAFAQRAPTADALVTDASARAPRRITRLFTRLDSEGWTVDRPRHLWVVPADGSLAPRDLTPGEHAFEQPAWVPDGSALVCVGAAHDDWEFDLAEHVHLVPLTGDRRQLTTTPMIARDPSPSPDGRTVAFVGRDDPDIDPLNLGIGLVPIEGGAHRWLDTRLDRTWGPYPSAGRPRWLDDAHLLAAVEDQGDVHVYRVPTGGGHIERVVGGDRCVVAFDAAAGVLVAALSTCDRPAEAFAVRAGAEQQLSDAAASFRAQARPIAPARLTAGDHDVDVWVYEPPGFDAARRHAYPMLVNIHGGPFTQFGNRFFDEAQVQAGAGYVVVLSNPRGGSGRETAWGRAIAGSKSKAMPGTGWGSVDADDIHTVVDAVLARYPAIDPARVGVLGGSYGGYLTSWLVSHSDRFAAACSERAVNNLLTLEFTSDIATVFRTELGVTHLDDPEEYLRRSPVSYVRDIHTPLLILHSEDDLRCPISQAEELFVALRMLRRDVTFVRFPAESHELSRSGSPVHRRQRFEIQLDFFAQHLKPAS